VERCLCSYGDRPGCTHPDGDDSTEEEAEAQVQVPAAAQESQRPRPRRPVPTVAPRPRPACRRGRCGRRRNSHRQRPVLGATRLCKRRRLTLSQRRPNPRGLWGLGEARVEQSDDSDDECEHDTAARREGDPPPDAAAEVREERHLRGTEIHARSGINERI